jgi:hypothetical protein
MVANAAETAKASACKAAHRDHAIGGAARAVNGRQIDKL